MLRALAIWAVLGLTPGCGAEDPRYPVRVGELFQGEGPLLEAELRAALEEALAGSPTFAAADRMGALRAQASLLREGPPERWVLRVELEVPADLRAQFAVATITGSASAGVGVLPDSGALRRAAEAALTGLAAQCKLARGDESGFDALIGADEPESVLVALRYVRDRHASGLADRLVGLLRREDPRIRIAALDVLAAVGDSRHAAAIVRGVHLLDPQATREAYRALARLGGPDAIGFLGFAAANEDDATLRGEAERALSSALSGEATSAADAAHGVDLPKLARGHRQ